MNIGIIGSGGMGGGLGKIWTAKGHHVLFSDAHDASHLPELVKQAGPNAYSGSPAEAAEFGDVVLLTVRWANAGAALKDIAADLAGKPLISCINPFKADFSQMDVPQTTSGAEEVAKMAPGAYVVECLFLGGTVINSPTRQFGDVTPTVFYCGDDTASKQKAAVLIADIGVEAVDAGPLQNARFLEPYNMLVMQLGLLSGWKTDFALKLLKR